MRTLVIFFQLWCSCSLFFRGTAFIREDRVVDGVMMLIMGVLLGLAVFYWDSLTRVKK